MPFSDAHPPWSPLHDFALICLALMHGASTEIHPAEDEAVQHILTERYPEAGPDRIRRAMHDAMLTYIGAAGDQMLNIAVASLRQTLPKQRRITLLDDLASIASADGAVVPAEVSFIQHLAREWDVEQELQR